MLVHFLRGLQILGLFDDRIYNVGLASRIHLFLEKAVDALDAILGNVLGRDGLSSRRHFVDHGDIQVAINRERQRARNGRSGHHQNIRGVALGRQPLPLHDAEAMLFVDDREAQLLPFDILFDQSVRADADLHQTGRQKLLQLRFFPRGGGSPVSSTTT